MRTALLVLTPWLWRKTMISRICIPSCQAVAIRSRRFGPMPSTDSKSAGLSLMTPSTSAPKCPTSFFARTGPTPFTKPPAKYRSTPSLVVGGTAFRTWALNWRPCSLSRTHHPFAVSHSPALTDGNEPRTVTRSRCPRTFTRSTANPLSSLKKVTRSTRPAISSDGVCGCGEESLILIEVYGAGVEFGIPNRAFLLQSPQGTHAGDMRVKLDSIPVPHRELLLRIATIRLPRCWFPCPHLERIDQVQLPRQFAAAELEKITHEIALD